MTQHQPENFERTDVAAPDGSPRVAVVTGAGGGIGAAICARLVESGHTVLVTDLDADAARATGEKLGQPWKQVDVTDSSAVGAVAEEVAEGHGRLDVWVSNAGISKMQRFTDISDRDWDTTMAVNAGSVFRCGRAAAATMIRLGRGGCIVNTASMAAKQGGVPFLADYVASKFAVLGLTQAMAYELAEHRIRVNCVCPGFVSTPMQERERHWEAELRGLEPEEIDRMWVAATPWGRLQEPDDVATAVAFLASPQAGFITGEALSVNGGAYMD